MIEQLGFEIVKLVSAVDGKGSMVSLQMVFNVLEPAHCIISITKSRGHVYCIAVDSNCTHPPPVWIGLLHTSSNSMKTVENEKGGLYQAVISIHKEKAYLAANYSSRLWQERLGHCFFGTLKASVSRVAEAKLRNVKHCDEQCKAGALGKAICAPRNSQHSFAETTNQTPGRVCMDLVRPVNVESLKQFR